MFLKAQTLLLAALLIAKATCVAKDGPRFDHDHHHDHHDHHHLDHHHHHQKFLNPHAPLYANHKTNRGPANAFPRLPESHSDDRHHKHKEPLLKHKDGPVKGKLLKPAKNPRAGLIGDSLRK